MRQVVLFVHLLAAVFWIGEILALGLIVGPYARSLPQPRQSELFRAFGNRSLPLAWGAIALLFATGLLNLVYMGIPLRALVTPTFYHSRFGLFLGLKLLAVLAMVTVAAVHDFVVAGRSRRAREAAAARPDDPATRAVLERYRRLALRLGLVNFALAFLVLFFAAGLVVYGG
jgi:putative copper resistance protein D